MPDFEDFGVIIPYSRLCDLLQASAELKALRKDVKRLAEQQTALRGQFMEMMELLRELL